MKIQHKLGNFTITSIPKDFTSKRALKAFYGDIKDTLVLLNDYHDDILRFTHNEKIDANFLFVLLMKIPEIQKGKIFKIFFDLLKAYEKKGHRFQIEFQSLSLDVTLISFDDN